MRFRFHSPYVGEEPLPAGRYTYVLIAQPDPDGSRHLVQELRKDP